MGQCGYAPKFTEGIVLVGRDGFLTISAEVAIQFHTFAKKKIKVRVIVPTTIFCLEE
jgi:hypothetical protein